MSWEGIRGGSWTTVLGGVVDATAPLGGFNRNRFRDNHPRYSSLECLMDIGDEVVRFLNTNAQTDEVRSDTQCSALGFGDRLSELCK